MQRILVFVVIIFVCFPYVVEAADNNIIITEISAYENSNHEWIEIYNKGNTQLDLNGWKFFESDTNHSLSAYRGGLIIQPGTYAIIADDAAATAADYPFYQGILIDSSWTTLNEGGELIALKNANNEVVEQFTYIEAQDHSLERVNYSLNDYSNANWKEHANGNTIGAANSTVSQQFVSLPSQQKIFENFKPGKGSVVINEIVTDASDDGKEWVELYNVLPVGVDLGGWSMTTGSGTTFPVAGYLDAAGRGKYKVFDFPFGTLKNAGDRIMLTDSQKNIIDTVTYGSWEDGIRGDNAPRAANPYSLARIRDGYRTDVNGEDLAVTSLPTRGEPNIILDPPTLTVSIPYRKEKPHIFISELFVGQSDHGLGSFIELSNDSERDIYLDGWFLENTDGARFAFADDDIMKSHSYYVWRGNSIKNLLNNDKETIIRLFDGYTNESPITLARYVGRPIMNASYAYRSDHSYDWTIALTPSTENIFIKPSTISESFSVQTPLSDDTGKKTSQPIKTLIESSTTPARSDTNDDMHITHMPNSDIIINEVFPNPEGIDVNEFIELYNRGDNEINITGWKLGTIKNKKQFIIPQGSTILPQSYFIVSQEETSLTLQNVQDGVQLFSEQGALIESVIYEKPPEEKTWARRDDGSFAWTARITRGEKNTFNEPLPVQSTALSQIAQKKTNQNSITNTTSLVIIESTIVVEPELFGKGLFVINDPAYTVVGESGQMQGLARGDRVRMIGRTSKREGDPRFNLQKGSTITILSRNETIVTREISGGLLTDDDIGDMVTISGTVSRVQWPTFWIDDGIDETRVYVKKSSGIERFAVQIGDEAEVSGVVSTTAAGLRVLPRTGDDIRITPKQKEATVLRDDDRRPSPSSLRDYLFATIAVLAMVFGGLLINYLGKK